MKPRTFIRHLAIDALRHEPYGRAPIERIALEMFDQVLEQTRRDPDLVYFILLDYCKIQARQAFAARNRRTHERLAVWNGFEYVLDDAVTSPDVVFAVQHRFDLSAADIRAAIEIAKRHLRRTGFDALRYVERARDRKAS